MKTVFSDAVKGVITVREDGSRVLTTSNGIDFEFGETVPMAAMLSGMCNATIYKVMHVYPCAKAEFSFSLRLKNQ